MALTDRLIDRFHGGLLGGDYQIPVRNSTSFIYEPLSHTILFSHSREQTARLCRRFLAYHTSLPVLCITIRKSEFVPGTRFLAYDLRSREIDYGAYDGWVTYPKVRFYEKSADDVLQGITDNYRCIKILHHLKPLCDDIAKLDDLKTQMIGYLDIIKTEYKDDEKLMEIVKKDIEYTNGKSFTDHYESLTARCLDITGIDKEDDKIIQALRIRKNS